jgi:hypothetical protein
VGTHSDKEEKRKRWRLLERSGVYKERMCAPHRQALESQLVRFHAKKERKKDRFFCMHAYSKRSATQPHLVCRFHPNSSCDCTFSPQPQLDRQQHRPLCLSATCHWWIEQWRTLTIFFLFLTSLHGRSSERYVDPAITIWILDNGVLR